VEHDALARLALTFDAQRRAFTRIGLAALGAFLLLFALSFAGSGAAFAWMFRLGSLVMLPWLPWMWIVWFHPSRGTMRPDSRYARFVPAPALWLGRWYGAFVIVFTAAGLLAAPFLL
jgi:hypothetical protein